MREKNFLRFLLLELAALMIIYYDGMLCWELAGLFAYGAALFVFLRSCLKVSGEERKERAGYLSCFYALFAAPVFPNEDYFGSAQMYLMIPALLLLSAAAVGKRKKWFVPVALAAALLLAYVPGGASAESGNFFDIPMTGGWRMADLIVFLLLLLPYLWLAACFFAGLMKKENDAGRRHLPWLLGGLLFVPAFFREQGYGNLMFSFFFYFMSVFMLYYCTGEPAVEAAAESCEKRIGRLGTAKLLLLIYPVLLQPLADFPLSRLSGQVLRFFS